MTIELRVIKKDERDVWDHIVDQSPHGTLFHQFKWLEITEHHTHTRLIPLIGMRDGEPVGIIPLFYQKKGIFKMVFSPPPRAALFYMGPVIINYESLRQDKREDLFEEFQEAVDSYIKTDLAADYVNIALSPNLQDPRPYAWSGYTVTPFYDYQINLSAGTDYLFQTIEKKRRQDINRAKKKGICVETGSRKECDRIMDLLNERYKQQSVIQMVPKEYVLDLYDAFSENITIFIATFEGEIITGLIDLHYRDSIYSWIGNFKPVIPISPSPSDLVGWEAVKYGCEKGFKSYVLLSAAGNKRLHSYNAAKFNPELKIRFAAKKNSLLSGIFEKGYTGILKPLRGKLSKTE
jgi:hypothetical protein